MKMGLWDTISGIFGRNTYTINGVKYVICRGDGAFDDLQLDLMSLPAVSFGVETLVNDIMQMPFHPYLRSANGGRQRMFNAMDSALNVKPNAYANAAEFKHQWALQAILYQSFISIRGGQWRILDPDHTYRYTMPTGEVRYATIYSAAELQALGLSSTSGPVIKADYAWPEVLHLYAYADPTGTPVPFWARFRTVLGLGNDYYKYTCNLYNRGGALVGYLQTDKAAPDEQKINVVKAFKEVFKLASKRRISGSTSEGSDIKLAALDNGWKFQALNLTPQEMMLLETKKDWKRDVADMLRLPPWKLGIVEEYKYASSETASRDYLMQALNPLLYWIERELNAKLVDDTERPFIYIEADRDKILQIDSKTQAEIEDLRIKNGSMTPNEARAIHNQPAVPGGDVRQVQVNTTSAEYAQASEALKLEGLRLANAEKAAKLQMATSPTSVPSQQDPPAAPDPAADPATYEAMQRSAIEQIADGAPEKMAATVDSVIHQVAKLHGADPASLGRFREAYLAGYERRRSAGPVNVAYEANRIINSVNHEAMRRLYGERAKAKWRGGRLDGQTRMLAETWHENMKHPPLSSDETCCFLVRG